MEPTFKKLTLDRQTPLKMVYQAGDSPGPMDQTYTPLREAYQAGEFGRLDWLSGLFSTEQLSIHRCLDRDENCLQLGQFLEFCTFWTQSRPVMPKKGPNIPFWSCFRGEIEQKIYGSQHGPFLLNDFGMVSGKLSNQVLKNCHWIDTHLSRWCISLITAQAQWIRHTHL